MVELPLDDAATRYRKIAEKIEDIRWTMDVSDLKGATSDQLNATIEGFNTFISTAADKLMDQASTVTDQHGADEGLRDNSLPVKEIEALEEKAEKLERLTAQTVTKFSANTGIAQAAVMARAEAEYERQRRESALGRHTLSASTNAPKLLVTPPSLTGAGVGGLFGSGGTDSHDGGSRVLPQTGGGSGGGGGGTGAGSAGLPSAASAGAGGGSLGGSSVDATDIGTETSSDGLMGGGTGAAGQPMMGQPMQAQGQPQQPTMPSMAGTGAAGAGGMLGTANGAGARSRKRDRKDEPRTDLSGAGFVAGGLGGAAAGAAAAGVDRGVSVSGVNTKADTSGLGTNLSGAGGKPGGGGAPTPNMMRGGMMGGMGPMMGGMGSGAQGTTKDRPDIKPLVKDRDLNGLDSLERGIDGGIIGRDTAEAPDETGIDRYLDPDKLNIADTTDKKER